MVNGKQTDLISVRDRGLQYGDGCFETIRIYAQKPILLKQHLHRLQSTCDLLRLEFNQGVLMEELSAFLQQCDADGVVKIILTRGIGGRGYLVNEQVPSSRVLMYSPYPENYAIKCNTGISVGISDYRLPENAFLAGRKHLNRLDQVLASFDLDDSVDEVICRDQDDHVIEGTKSNIVLVVNGKPITPDLKNAGVKGVMLDFLAEKFAESGVTIEPRSVTLSDIYSASEVLFCNSVFGIWPVRKLIENATVHTWQIGPFTRHAMQFHHDLLDTAIQSII